MASLPFPGIYNPSQHTGDGIYVFTTSPDIMWICSNSSPSGAAMFRSYDYGTTFEYLTALPGILGSLAFDPAIALSSIGLIAIIGQIQNPLVSVDATSLVMYTFNTGSLGLVGPITLSTGVVGSDYDVVALTNGNFYVVTEMLDGHTSELLGIEVTPTGSIVRQDDLASNTFRGPGNSYSAISLVTPDGVNVEVYVAVMPRTFQFTLDQTNQAPAQLFQIIQNAGVVTSNAALYSLNATYIPDKLNVIYNSNVRYLSMSFLTQIGNVTVGHALLGQGIGPSGLSGSWAFGVRFGTLAHSIMEPTLFLSPSGLVFAYLDVAPATGSTVDSPVVLQNLS